MVVTLHGLMLGRWIATGAQLGSDFQVLAVVLAGGFSFGLAGYVGHASWAMSILDRFEGAYSNPNGLAMVAALSLFIGIGLLREGCGRIAPVALIATAGVSLVLTGTRSAVLASIVGILLLLIRARGHGRLVALGLAAVAFTLGLLLNLNLQNLVVFQRLDEAQVALSGGTADGLSGRTGLWQQTLDDPGGATTGIRVASGRRSIPVQLPWDDACQST